jgi:hypothetical protein
MRSENIGVIMAAEHYGRDKVETVASRAGAKAVMMPLSTGSGAGTEDYFGLVNTWVQRLSAAFGD